jgi:hypothetical protein
VLGVFCGLDVFVLILLTVCCVQPKVDVGSEISHFPDEAEVER